MYHDYKIARNKAWETLIKCNITSLPINLATIARIKQHHYTKI